VSGPGHTGIYVGGFIRMPRMTLIKRIKPTEGAGRKDLFPQGSSPQNIRLIRFIRVNPDEPFAEVLIQAAPRTQRRRGCRGGHTGIYVEAFIRLEATGGRVAARRAC
jgi:hypothetical protein